MGGVVKKVFGKDKTPSQAVESAPTATQTTSEAGYEDSEDRSRKKNKRKGKKRLQIPTGTTGVATTASGGTGLGTGV